ncbi:MAG: NFACT family protein [Clostridia bacterium]|nr:NFACT family protein [Clostridia bacterium]
MAFDGIYLHFIAKELNDKLKNSRIYKLYQISKNELIIIFRGKEQSNQKLLISTDRSFCRIHLTTKEYDNPKNPSVKCMYLRKKLLGARFTGAFQVSNDRFLKINLKATNEVGDVENLELKISLISAIPYFHINNNGKTIFSLNDSQEYEISKDEKLNIFQDDLDKIADMIAGHKKGDFTDILNSIQGISPSNAKTLYNHFDFENYKTIAFSLLEFKKYLSSDNVVFNILNDDNKYTDLTFLSNNYFDEKENLITYSSPSEAADDFYFKKARENSIKNKTADLHKKIQNLIKRKEKKVKTQKKELSESKNREKYRLYGELLTTYNASLPRGKDEYTVFNYYTNEEINIPVNPAYHALENARRYYKKYQKTYNAEKELQKQIKITEKTLEYLYSVEDLLSRTYTEDEIIELKNELISQKILKKSSIKKHQKNTKLSPLKFTTDDGFEIFAGRNNIQNDKLTLKKSEKTDLWFHTKDFPSSHIILKSKNGKFSDEAIKRAAEITALNSKARESSNVPVDYTLVKYVKKPAGSPPGKVIYTNQKTIFVNPMESKS